MKRYRVDPGQKIALNEWDPEDVAGFVGGKDQAVEEVALLNQRLDALQELLYAEHKQRLLVILQGMDTAGKDGVIRAVFEGVNPQGVKVAGFKVPTPVELDHDYLWRVHPHIPGKGEIVIFNRSHYEDVLVVRVHKLVAEEVWQRRYDQINAFEKMLAEEGVTLLKFFLHISPEEQRKRLLARLEDPTKRWKFNPGDLEERKLWPDYMAAYEDVLSRTGQRYAPWYIVPANKKWFRNLVIARTLVEILEKMEMKTPQAFTEEEITRYRRVLAKS